MTYASFADKENNITLASTEKYNFYHTVQQQIVYCIKDNLAFKDNDLGNFITTIQVRSYCTLSIKYLREISCHACNQFKEH